MYYDFPSVSMEYEFISKNSKKITLTLMYLIDILNTIEMKMNEVEEIYYHNSIGNKCSILIKNYGEFQFIIGLLKIDDEIHYIRIKVYEYNTYYFSIDGFPDMDAYVVSSNIKLNHKNVFTSYNNYIWFIIEKIKEI